MIVADDRQKETEPELLSLVTLVAWLMCLAVGVLGLFLHYAAPRSNREAVMPPTEMVNVEIASTPPPQPEVVMPPPEIGNSSPELSSPAAPPALAVPEALPVTTVAAPSPAISFALPVEGLTRLVDVNRAAHSGPVNGAAGSASGVPGGVPGGVSGGVSGGTSAGTGTVAPVIVKLTLGEGEGRQPSPEYPRAAVVAHQEGVVGLRFTVGEDGHVQSVEVVSASRWPVLNQAATRTVREQWHFSAGPRRIYEVSIQFELNQ